MTIHLLRMAVGIDDLDHLRRVQAARRAADDQGRLFGFTRNMPKRAAEVLDGGSMYWIIKGYIRVRQPILGLERRTDEDGRTMCAIEYGPELVPTVLQTRRPQQGWRYLEPADAPPDRFSSTQGAEDLPPDLAAELRDLGVL